MPLFGQNDGLHVEPVPAPPPDAPPEPPDEPPKPEPLEPPKPLPEEPPNPVPAAPPKPIVRSPPPSTGGKYGSSSAEAQDTVIQLAVPRAQAAIHMRKSNTFARTITFLSRLPGTTGPRSNALRPPMSRASRKIVEPAGQTSTRERARACILGDMKAPCLLSLSSAPRPAARSFPLLTVRGSNEQEALMAPSRPSNFDYRLISIDKLTTAHDLQAEFSGNTRNLRARVGDRAISSQRSGLAT